MNPTNHEIIPATHKEVEFLETKLDEFNRSQIPLAQKKTVFKNYVIKDEEKIIAGISAMSFLGVFCSLMLYLLMVATGTKA